MNITMREEGAVTVLALKGRLDLASGSTLKEEIKKQFDNGRVMIHLNLCDVEFINSSGLGTLVSVMKEVKLLKGRLTISNLASYVEEIFEITQLSHIFEVFPTESEAMASFHPVTTS